MGILQKAGNFLGISKFGQGLATSYRALTGQVDEDIRRQEQQTEQTNKIFLDIARKLLRAIIEGEKMF